MKIIIDKPPNFSLLLTNFGSVIERRGVVFTYGDAIYNPSGDALPPWIVQHERTHSEQQKLSTPDLWWQRYIEDKQFRFNEELMAHCVELAFFERMNSGRHTRRAYRCIVTERLSGPLYGKLCKLSDARAALKRLTPFVEKGIKDHEAGRVGGLDAGEGGGSPAHPEHPEAQEPGDLVSAPAERSQLTKLY